MQNINELRLRSSAALESVSAYYLNYLKPLLLDKSQLIKKIKSGNFTESEIIALVGTMDHGELDQVFGKMNERLDDLMPLIKDYNLERKSSTSEVILSELVSRYLLYGAESAYKYLEELSKKTSFSELNISFGDMYYYGIGVEKNINVAKEYYSLAIKFGMIKNGIASCIGDEYFVRGQDYQSGLCREYNLDKAKENYEKAFELGNLNAGISLILMYFNCFRDYNSAAIWCKKVIDQGESDRIIKPSYDMVALARAYISLGYMIINGFYTDNDLTAVKCFEEAYKLGDGSVLYELGAMYECGYETDVDYHKAMEYYDLAIEHYEQTPCRNEEHKATLEAAKKRAEEAYEDCKRKIK